MSRADKEAGRSLRGGAASLLGLGAYLPSVAVDNDMICENIQSSDEWITNRSGIRLRYWADEAETVQLMAVRAGRRALENAEIAPTEIDCVIVATVSHLHQMPSLAASVAHHIGADTPAAFDVSAACAGFSYGVALAADVVTAGSAKYVLVIAVDRFSELIDKRDKNTAFLFGDGAGAVVVGPSDEPGIGPVSWGSHGSQADAIRQTAPWSALRDAPGEPWPRITMQGRQVFKWAAFHLAPVAKQAMERAAVSVEELGAFIPHQANMRITDRLVAELKLPDHVAVARSIETHGNTSAASIPLAMHAMLTAGDVQPGSLALLLAFGSGLVWASQVVRLPERPVERLAPADAASA
nr:beta-ketoacyl-ACP synthase III [Streptomyces chartreusis]